MPDNGTNTPRAVFIDGCRTPFLRSGTAFEDLSAYDLGRMAVKGLVTRTGIDPAVVDRVLLGNVVQNVSTSNVAREAALGAGFPPSVPAATVTMACISGNLAITTGLELIRAGRAGMVVAGGTDTLSDLPIRFRRGVRKRLFAARKAKSMWDYAKLFGGLVPTDLLPEVPEIAEYSTGETMGESADKLAAMFGVSRQAQDEYAVRSHHRAARARREGLLAEEIAPAFVAPGFDPITDDNGIRPDTDLEKLAALRPAFVRPYGTVTAGNASYLTDGAAAVLLMAEEKARAEGLVPRAVLREYIYVSQSPGEELLLGPAYAIPRVLDAAGLSLADIDVFELHEAFAGQMLAVLEALRSKTFAEQHLDRSTPVGEIPPDRLNAHGGSLSLGHPFGATGARLVTTAVNRLHREDGGIALVAACAAGGQGHAMLIERLA